MVQILKTALAAFVSTSLVAAAAQAQTATADDMAKFLAGLRPAARLNHARRRSVIPDTVWYVAAVGCGSAG